MLILGASGGVGRRVVQQAVERGHAVVALVRAQTQVALPSAQIVRGDVLDSGVVESAVTGCDAVVSCLGIRRKHPRNPWSSLASPADLVERATRIVTAAMVSSGVRRVVTISAAGVGDSRSTTNVVMRVLIRSSNIHRAYRDLEAMERILAATDLDWMTIRPVTLLDLRPRAETVEEVSRYRLTATIARATLAAFMLDQVEQKEPFDKRVRMIAGRRSSKALRTGRPVHDGGKLLQ